VIVVFLQRVRELIELDPRFQHLIDLILRISLSCILIIFVRLHLATSAILSDCCKENDRGYHNGCVQTKFHVRFSIGVVVEYTLTSTSL
jgi:hypothetical protein